MAVYPHKSSCFVRFLKEKRQYKRDSYTLVSFLSKSRTRPSLRPESSENIPILFQGADLDFSNQNDLNNLKMSSKQSVPDATE